MNLTEDGIWDGTYTAPRQPAEVSDPNIPTPTQRPCRANEVRNSNGVCVNVEATCPNGQIWSGGRVGGRCVCSNGGDPANNCGTGQQAQQPAPPPPCVAEVRSLLNQCQGQLGSTRSSCDGATRLQANQAQAERHEQAMQNASNAQEVCQRNADFFSGLSGDLDQFASSCRSSISQCSSSCQAVQQRAAGCNHPSAQRDAQTAAGIGSSCQSLQSNANQASQQSQSYRQQVLRDAQSCQSSTNASERPNDPSRPSNKATDMDAGQINTQTLGSGRADQANTSGDLGVGQASSNPRGDTARVRPRDAVEGTSGNSGLNPFSQSGSGGALNDPYGHYQLANLPTRASASFSDDSFNGEKTNERVNPALQSGGTYGGSGGNSRRTLMGMKPLSGISTPSSPELAASGLNASGLQTPDLNQFRPSWVTGMVRCQDASSATALILRRKMSTQCIHGPSKSLFDAMKYRYEVQTMDNRFFAE